MVTMANELIGMARFFTKGIPVTKDTLAIEALQRVRDAGPKGIFLTDDHTFEHFENALFIPNLLDRSRYDAWEAEGSQDLYQRCQAEAKRILETHEPTPKDDEVLRNIGTILNSLPG
jgi:trimethylamine--corrinoid protein Co-methyltransferase